MTFQDAPAAARQHRRMPPACCPQNRLREGVQREAALSQASIDAKAQELLGGLALATSGASTGPRRLASSPHRAQPAVRPLAAARPATSSAPAPAVAAAAEAMAALRMQLPPSPAKLRSSAVGSRPAIRLVASSGSQLSPAPRAPAYSVRFAAAAAASTSSDSAEHFRASSDVGGAPATSAAVPWQPAAGQRGDAGVAPQAQHGSTHEASSDSELEGAGTWSSSDDAERCGAVGAGARVSS